MSNNGLGLPFSWMGTKVKMRRVLLPILEQIPRTLYAEPFCGAGGLFFGKPQEKAEVLNDSNRAIINVFKALQDATRRERVLELLTMMPSSRAAYEMLEPIVLKYMMGADFTQEKRVAGLSSLDDDTCAAYAFLYAQNNTFAGAGICRGFCGDAKGKDAARFIQGWNNTRAKLPAFATRLVSVQLECLDALDFLYKYDHNDTLFFIDPPYWCPSSKNYKSDWNKGKEIELVDFLCNCRASYVLTVYNTTNYERLLQHGAQCLLVKTRATTPTIKSTMTPRTEFVYCKSGGNVLQLEQDKRRDYMSMTDVERLLLQEVWK